jgi:hypothetical protein
MIVLQPGPLKTAPAAGLRFEREAVSKQHQLKAQSTQQDEALHENAEDVFAPDHSALEKCRSRRHEHYQGR